MRIVMKSSLIMLSICSLIFMVSCSNQANHNVVKENDSNAEIEVNTDDHEQEVEKADNAVIELFDAIEFSVLEKGKELGTFGIDLKEPKIEYKLEDGTEIVFEQYFPDFIFVDEEPQSQSDYPVNPAFIFTINKDGNQETTFVKIGGNLAVEDDPVFGIDIVDYSLKKYEISN